MTVSTMDSERASPIVRRLQRARNVMASHAIDALLILSGDPHFTEVAPPHWQLREWLCGFTGSAGTLVITVDRAILFTDSRYWEQAQTELAATGVAVGRLASGTATDYLAWLAAELPRGARIAVDGQALGMTAAKTIDATFADAGLECDISVDLCKLIWGADRPAAPDRAVRAHTAPRSGLPRSSKLLHLRAAMRDVGATHHLLSSLDDIAWLLNLRGTDLPTSPLFLSFAVIDALCASLFIAEGVVTESLRDELKGDAIEVRRYGDIVADLGRLPGGSRLLVDPKRTSLALRRSVPSSVDVIEALNPTTLAKSRKTTEEAACIRAAMREDGAAMCEFYAWFESALAAGAAVTEIDVGERLDAARATREGFASVSFPTIAAFNANAALPHYRASLRSNTVIKGDGLLLIDSGGQYLGGTTDITRMWSIGAPSLAQKRDVTLVLKAMIGLSRTRFPRGTLSPMLDAIARRPLWEHGLDFAHGTGHGVGFFLNVHEGPQSISRRMPEASMAMEPGMVTSIEPGVYRVGRWGVRIENLVLNIPVDTPERDAFGAMLEFEALSLCPIDTRCLLPELLQPDEIDWLDRYNAIVRERLLPLVECDARAWLERRTQPLEIRPA